MFRRLIWVAIAVATAFVIIFCRSIQATTVASNILENRTELSGGEYATTHKITSTAFAQPLKNLDSKRRRIFTFGDHLFNTQWIQAPSSVSMDGLGPLFNRNSCAGCHLKDGRGRAPLPNEDRMMSKLVRLSIPGQNANGSPIPHPIYGGQLQEQGILGVAAEGRTNITWTEETGQFADGTTYSLRRPHYEFTDLAYGDLGEETLFSARVAPAVFGLGLLENIPEANILENADPDDQDNDGISGRPNYVWDEVEQAKSLGRFGWKANQPSLIQQNASAFNGDIGITTTLFSEASCSASQTDCQDNTQFGEQPEVSDAFLTKLNTYIRLLAVPARRKIDGKKEQLGEKLFYDAQCATCHLPKQLTGNASPHAEFNHQVIHPYTDLLLHDMGTDLADDRPDFEANGQEWRSPPLWGMGLIETVNKHTFLLHDGRARNPLEAVLWHGGEAQTSKEFVKKLPLVEREALVAFLESL